MGSMLPYIAYMDPMGYDVLMFFFLRYHLFLKHHIIIVLFLFGAHPKDHQAGNFPTTTPVSSQLEDDGSMKEPTINIDGKKLR